MALVNEGEPPSALRARPHGTCLRYKPAVESLDLARRGDAAALREVFHRAPDVLASAAHAASLLHVAALAGRVPVVELLLDSGVDVNKPSPIEPLIFVTPLCAARAKRRKESEALLLNRGAKEDIFTHAFLGNLAGLHEDLARDPSSAQAIDPAVDALEITPVHHAVVGGRSGVARSSFARIESTSRSRWRARATRGGGAGERRDGRDAYRTGCEGDVDRCGPMGSPSPAGPDALARWGERRSIRIVDWTLVHRKSRSKG